ncbi:MAG: grasp-with-spasm system ATP-grasp peptide maturase [Bacteroidetes bacterium]|nr:grasp-with-spasm system ATP-grasp peptide maturase [Bacteroidota bacterium]
MILILNKSGLEPSAEDVMDWLNYQGAKWVRLNGADLEKNEFCLQINEKEDSIVFGDNKFDTEAIDVVWYWRWADDFPHKKVWAVDSIVSSTLKSHYQLELKKLRQGFFHFFEKAKWFTRPDDDFNKITVLRIAKKIGFRIPNTFIATDKKQLIEAKGSNTVITKCISDAPIFFTEESVYLLYTKVFETDFNELQPYFFPTLFQENIEKQYELRVFFINGDCYAMAIFSQLDAKTKTDFRQYNAENPNRMIPYRLPAEEEFLIIELMKQLNLNFGSLDLIRDIDGNLVFLEVNPLGQFGMTSRPCNYYLEKVIADALIEKSRK